MSRRNPETILKREILLALNAIPGVRFWNNVVGFDDITKTHYGLAKGSADLIGTAHGRFVGLEVKTPKGRLSPDQKLWLEAVNRLGGVGAVVRSVDEAIQIVTRITQQSTPGQETER